MLLAPSLAAATPGIFVLGVDGMDPEISQRLMDAGELPNLAQLAKEGSFDKLGTSTPPQSPVAWSNFVTGLDPGGHGIYDFVHRDPATYMPISSATPAHVDEPWVVNIGGFYIPLSGGDTGNNRGGTPWWDALDQAGVDVEVYRIPGNFPVPVSNAKTLAGMGTVDMRGGYGTYSWYTTKPHERQDIKGDIQLVTVRDDDLDGIGDTANAVLRGPPDLFRLEPGAIPKESDHLTARLTIHVDPENAAAVVRVGDHKALVQQGEWSDWVPVTFDALPWGLMPVEGAVRFYAKELRPELKLYASPVNISPASPAMPLTSPDDWVEDLHDQLGFFYTQGMPEETDALKDRTFTDDDYLMQVDLVQQDTEQMLELAIERFEPGDATFLYMSDIDLQCHMLWRHRDPKYPGAPAHPAMDDHAAAHKHSDDIEGFYRDVDAVVGRVRAELPEGTTLLVMSDHGFQPYTRKVHLNTWLLDNGYLVLKGDAAGQEGEAGMLESLGYLDAADSEGASVLGSIPAGSVDWSKTRAYALGFNGLYLNQKGREAEGIVDPAQADALMDEISSKLLAFTDDGRDGARVVKDVRKASVEYHGGRIGEAPDLVVGYDKHYGTSDQSTLGEVMDMVIEDNTSRWSGNHLMSPDVVPGVVFSSKPITGTGHDLTDLTATLLAHYGISNLPGMTGESIYKE